MSELPNASSAPPVGDISQLTEHLFRHESAKLVSILTGIFGIERLQLAEDVVQEAMLRALHTWPYYGVPKNPPAWLTQTAKNIALDVIRREKNFREKEPQIITHIEQWANTPEDESESEIKDHRLKLMFACCHPLIPQDAQAALALKTLCGFSAIEISKAFLTSEAAIEKRLVRARQKIRESRIKFEIPSGEEISPRLDAVLQTLYLLFNEGYKASVGEKLVREDLCMEAIRLVELLAGHAAGNKPKTHALAALLKLNAARLRARSDSEGNLLRLKDQDRSKWNKTLIGQGMYCLARSAGGEEVSAYHLQAVIAACHTAAQDYQSTDWKRILSLYDQLIHLEDSPVLRLNRAVALAEVRGPEEAIEELTATKVKLDSYYLFHAVLAEFHMQLGQLTQAAEHLRKSLELVEIKSERALLERRLHLCEEPNLRSAGFLPAQTLPLSTN